MIKYIPVNQVDSPMISNIVRSIPTAVSFDIASSSGQQSSVVYEIAYYTKGEASFDEVRFNYVLYIDNNEIQNTLNIFPCRILWDHSSLMNLIFLLKISLLVCLTG